MTAERVMQLPVRKSARKPGEIGLRCTENWGILVTIQGETGGNFIGARRVRVGFQYGKRGLML